MPSKDSHGDEQLVVTLAGTGKLGLVGQCTAEVIGLDWKTDMAEARQVLGKERVLQGNVDPLVLFAPEVRARCACFGMLCLIEATALFRCSWALQQQDLLHAGSFK